MNQVMATIKAWLLDEYSSTLFDFWGEEPTRQTIQEA